MRRHELGELLGGAPGLQQGQPGGGVPQPAGDRDELPGPRPGPGDRRPSAQVAERGHTEHDQVGAHDVTARDARPDLGALVPHAVGERVEPRHGGVGGDAEADDERGRAGAHRGHVGEILRGGLAPDVVAARPVPPEMAALDEQIGGDHDPAVRGGEHRGVVAGAEQDVRPLR